MSKNKAEQIAEKEMGTDESQFDDSKQFQDSPVKLHDDPAVRTIKSQEEAKHIFTHEEIEAMGVDLAGKISVWNANKAEAKESAATWKGIVKSNMDNIEHLKNLIEAGEETKYVETEITFNYPTHGMKECVNIENREVLWTAEMTIEELNQPMNRKNMDEPELPFGDSEK